jgi:hypothetical protein
MVTVHRAFGFRFVIFTNDHEPAHVHVFGQGGEAKVDLLSPDGVIWVVGISRADSKRIIEEVRSQPDFLLSEWRRIHVCPGS